MLVDGKAQGSWRSTKATRLLEIDYPIVQAPFGGLPSQRLTAAVSTMGGLGSLGAVTLGASAIKDTIDEIRSLTSRPFAVNLWVSTSDAGTSHISPDQIQAKLQEFRGYYAELGIEAPPTVESRVQDFETQARAVIDARPAVISFIFGIPPAEIIDECQRQ